MAFCMHLPCTLDLLRVDVRPVQTRWVPHLMNFPSWYTHCPPSTPDELSVQLCASDGHQTRRTRVCRRMPIVDVSCLSAPSTESPTAAAQQEPSPGLTCRFHNRPELWAAWRILASRTSWPCGRQNVLVPDTSLPCDQNDRRPLATHGIQPSPQVRRWMVNIAWAFGSFEGRGGNP